MSNPVATTEALPPELARFPSAKLSVVKGPDKGRELVLEGQTVLIGTDEVCHLRLTDTSISRRHAELSGGPSGYRIRDLHSTNGVQVEGIRVIEGRLVDATRIHLGRTELRYEPLRRQVEWPVSQSTRFGEALGPSVAMRRLFALLERAAQTDAPVLLDGETGTGKTLLSRALHQRSARRDGPQVEVDASLGEVDLAGALQQARGGTLLLEDLTSLPPSAQALLSKQLERGASDPRLIATTSKDLELERRAGTLREDLYFAIGALRVKVPPLRERPEDIAPLVQHFIASRGRSAELSEETMDMLVRHPWPGNARELRSVVERLLSFPELGSGLLPDVLGPAAQRDGATDGGKQMKELAKLRYHDARDRVVDAFERAYFSEHLKASGGVVARAAQRAGLPRQSLYRMLKRLGLFSGPEE